ncbi:MAG: glycosyltransferase [Oscillospiraceae bacterium]|nr:glycosyltransferase [Oscillospiraceae bacterium]
MEHVKVTVWLSTYNQAPYVAQALDSIMMQKTSFPFEVVAADDCSTDGTQEIILQYQKQYPDQILPYFTNPNVGGCRKLCDCIDKGLFRGEYISFLEGDDYWLGENRLQTLVDFLDTHPEYSRVSHRRKVVDEVGNEKGFDIPESLLNKPFTIQDFLNGKSYSDFGSVFRNYFKEAGDKYHPLLLSSRNVCDFQDMFITQDFGPVFVMDRVFGAYRSRSTPGATNYNSITSQASRCKDHIRIARAAEEFYHGKYDLSPMILRQQKRLVSDAVGQQSADLLEAAREYVPEEAMRKIAPELIYLARRGRRDDEIRFLKENLLTQEKTGLLARTAAYSVKRAWRKLRNFRPNEKLRGYVRKG